MNVAARITQLADANDVDFMYRGNDRNDIDALADALTIDLDYHGSDEVALDHLAAAIAQLP